MHARDNSPERTANATTEIDALFSGALLPILPTDEA